MIKNDSYDFSVDIWSLGILLFELINGFNPFIGDNMEEKYENILMIEKLQFGESNSILVKDLILRLLDKNPNKRIKIKEIFNHPWMKSHEIFFDITLTDYIYYKNDNKKDNKALLKLSDIKNSLKKKKKKEENISDRIKSENNQIDNYFSDYKSDYNSSTYFDSESDQQKYIKSPKKNKLNKRLINDALSSSKNSFKFSISNKTKDLQIIKVD